MIVAGAILLGGVGIAVPAPALSDGNTPPLPGTYTADALDTASPLAPTTWTAAATPADFLSASGTARPDDASPEHTDPVDAFASTGELTPCDGTYDRTDPSPVRMPW